jgi:hypothetical protein
MIKGTETLKRLFDIFLREHFDALDYSYNHVLTESHRENISFDDWCNFAFKNSTVSHSIYKGVKCLQTI